MKTHTPLLRRLAAGLAAVALVGVAAPEARADFAYGFASQTISNLTITPATGTLTTANLSTFTQDGSTINGSGLANSAPLDAPQAYQGGPPVPPQNFFLRNAPGNPPVTPDGNFTRGDVLISSNSTGSLTSGAAVAESFLNTVLPGAPVSETGSGGLGASLSFTPSANAALTIAYNFSNDIFTFTTGGARATASYGFSITIRDASGAIVFSSQTANTNSTFTAPPQGAELIRTGTESVTTTALTAGQTYSIAFNVTAQSAVNAVPEPSSVVLCALGGLFPVGFRLLRKRNA